MSTRRVKNIEYDEDEFGEYADDDLDYDDYNPEDALDPENSLNDLTRDDRIQMRITVASVREQLEPAINDLVRPVEIWEKAWDTYYDAKKVTELLRSM